MLMLYVFAIPNPTPQAMVNLLHKASESSMTGLLRNDSDFSMSASEDSPMLPQASYDV
jgi:hypothetical protein